MKTRPRNNPISTGPRYHRRRYPGLSHGIGNIKAIAGELIRHGRPTDTPVAVIHRGMFLARGQSKGHLMTLWPLQKNEVIRPPGIIVVGEVVRLRDELNWFEARPLFGKRIIVTRARIRQVSSWQLLENWALNALNSLPSRSIPLPPGTEWTGQYGPLAIITGSSSQVSTEPSFFSDESLTWEWTSGVSAKSMLPP